MELDWCSDDTLSNTTNFNDKSVINKDKKKNSCSKSNELGITNNLSADYCFNLNLNVKNNKDLLSVLNYLSLVSNYLKTFIRNKATKHNEFIELTSGEYDSLFKYLEWLHSSCNAIKKFFSVHVRRDNSYDPNNIKLFKTSSYKFCNFKETCSIHKNKNKCDKNHFVFDMIINDISKLLESIQIIGIDNINWVLSNKIIKISYFEQDKKYMVEKINGNKNSGIGFTEELNENQFIIDKTLMFKSFNVISFVLNKMYDEAFCFINYDVNSALIDLNFSKN